MIIYQIRNDVDYYQYFLVAKDDPAERAKLLMNCESRQNHWNPPEVYIYQPRHKRGSFLAVGMGGAFACDQSTAEDPVMRYLLESSAELLPLPFEGETYYIINVLDCVNALDRERSQWHPAMKGTKVGIPQKYVFHRNRIPEVPLFKIPETSRTSILCTENTPNRELEFKRCYEQLGLTGLKFEKLWSDED